MGLHVIYVLSQIIIPCIVTSIAIKTLHLNLIHADRHVGKSLIDVECRIVPSLIALVGSRTSWTHIALTAIGTSSRRSLNRPSTLALLIVGIDECDGQVDVLLVGSIVHDSLDVKRTCAVNGLLQLFHRGTLVQIN